MSSEDHAVVLTASEEILKKRFAGCMRSFSGLVETTTSDPLELAAHIEPCVRWNGLAINGKAKKFEALTRVIARLRQEKRLVYCSGSTWLMEELIPEAPAKKRKSRQQSRQKLAQRRPIPAVAR